MALDGTYTGLQASVADWLNRSDLTSQVPDFIALAEAAMVALDPQTGEKLRVRQMVAQATSTFSAEEAGLPSDFLDMIELSLPDGRPVELVTTQVIQSYKGQLYPGAPSYWEPQACAIVGSQLQLFPAPTTPILLAMTYYQRIPPLSASNPSNWMLTSYPTAYLYGALLQAAPFLRDDERLATWSTLYRTAMQMVKAGDATKSQGRLHVDPMLVRRHRPWNIKTGSW